MLWGFVYARLNGKAKAVVLEVTKTPDGKHQVVSAFPMDEKSYRKLKDISGRSDVPSLDISPVESDISTAQKFSKSTISSLIQEAKPMCPSTTFPHSAECGNVVGICL